MIGKADGTSKATKDSEASLTTFITTATNFGDALLAYCMTKTVDLSNEEAICIAANELAAKRSANESDAVASARSLFEEIRFSEEQWNVMMRRRAETNR